MDHQKFPKATEILSDELMLAKWHEMDDPKSVFDTLDICVEKTYQRVRSACWGDNTRTIACDVLFREAKAGIAAARAGISAISLTTEPLPGGEEAADDENKPDWIQPILLIVSAALVLACSMRGFRILSMILGALSAICIIAALMREVQRLIKCGAPMKLVRFAAKLLRIEKLLNFAEASLEKKKAPAEAAPLRVKIAVKALGDACLHQMKIIDENLGLFEDKPDAASEQPVISPVSHSLLQEECIEDSVLPESVSAGVRQDLAHQGLIILNYTPENARYFQTQPMDETFTISPAILDKDGNVIEYGLAGVCEEQ